MSEPIGTFTKNDQVYTVSKGLTDSQRDEIIHHGQTDELIKKNTSDPKRFQDRDAFEHYMKKDPVFYSLTDQHNKFVGVIWFREKPLNQDQKMVFAMRTYAHGRGRGLSQSFMSIVFKDFIHSPEYVKSGSKGIWLDTEADNEIAQNVYTKFGFKKVSEPSAARVVMILDPNYLT